MIPSNTHVPPPDVVYGNDEKLEGKFQCDLFYEILEKEERYPFLKVWLSLVILLEIA